MNGITIFHLHFWTGGDFYYGSIAAIYDQFGRDVLRVTQQRLYDFAITPDHPYENKICIIRKGSIQRKKGNRKPLNKE